MALAAQAGTYFILVYNNLVTSPGSDYTIEVQAPPFAWTSFTPGNIGSDQIATVFVSGVFPLAYQSPNAYQIQFVSSGGTTSRARRFISAPTELSLGSSSSKNPNGTQTLSATLPANTLARRHVFGEDHRQPGQHQTMTSALDGDGRRHGRLEDQHHTLPIRSASHFPRLST